MKMNQYAVKGETGKTYGPFKTAHSAAKWANLNLRGAYGRPADWSIVRLFKP
jgi:hypothetical protein